MKRFIYIPMDEADVEALCLILKPYVDGFEVGRTFKDFDTVKVVLKVFISDDFRLKVMDKFKRE